MRQIHKREWKRVQHCQRTAQQEADQRHEPFAVVKCDGDIFTRPLRRALYLDSVNNSAQIVVEVFPSVTR